MAIDTIQILNKFISDLGAVVKRILIESGVESNSDLIKNLRWKPSNNGLDLVAFDYFIYLSTGRRPGARKVPISALIEWVKSKGIGGSSDVNQVAWAIQQGIYVNGIKGKNYFQTTVEAVSKFTAVELSKEIAKVLANTITEAFKNTNRK